MRRVLLHLLAALHSASCFLLRVTCTRSLVTCVVIYSSTHYGSDEEEIMPEPMSENEARVDPKVLSLIDDAYKKLKDTKSGSLLKKHLTPQVYDKIKSRKTASEGTLLDVIKSGVANPDSGIGIYAPDAESYALFHELFDPIIKEYHEVPGAEIRHPPVDFGNPDSIGNFNDFGNYVVSTRVRCARNLEGYPFNPLLTKDQYGELEQEIGNALDILDGDLAGYYKPLGSFSPEEAKKMIDSHFLFKQGDRFLEAANACRFWPHGRGIYLNSDNTLVIWVNEEDHMRIISMEKGGNLNSVYKRFIRAVMILENYLPFSHSVRLGHLSFCPTNLGTAIRASVHIRLRQLLKDPKMLEETADKFNLQVRGTRGEHSEAEDGVFDISNRRRLGLTEHEAMAEMYQGVATIIGLEQRLEKIKANKQRRAERL